jgi:hypothetical protein
MAGYDGFSMSNNAVNAYREGLLPASKVCSGIPAALIRQHCSPAECHHTSKKYNKTDFFDPDCVKGKFGIFGVDHEYYDEAAEEALRQHNVSRRIKDSGQNYIDCRVDWLDWSTGTVKRPKAIERTASGCTVLVRKTTAYITFEDGTEMVKRLETNGFAFTAEWTKVAREQAKAVKAQAKVDANEEKERQKSARDAQLAFERRLKLYGAKPINPENCIHVRGSEKAWAALSTDGRKVLGMMPMNGAAECRVMFDDYRECCKVALDSLGVVTSGYYWANAGVFEICERDRDLFPVRFKSQGVANVTT